MYDIVTFGSATKDIFVETGLREKDGYIAYPAGDKIPIKSLRFAAGGVGVNVAVGTSRMGLKTAYMGKLGNDGAADTILDVLKKEKIDFLGKQVKGLTGLGIILDSYEKHRTILTSHGVVDHFKFSEVNKNKLKTEWVFFSSLKDESFKTEEKLIMWLKKKGIKTAFNMDAYVAKKTSAKLKNILKNLTVIIMNKEEAQTLVKKKKIDDLLKGINKLGPEIVVVTDGSKAAYAYDGQEICSVKPHANIKVVETTGAGDAFASGFLSGLVKKNDIKLALKLGIANSESVIQHYGALNKLLRWNEALKKV